MIEELDITPSPITREILKESPFFCVITSLAKYLRCIGKVS